MNAGQIIAIAIDVLLVAVAVWAVLTAKQQSAMARELLARDRRERAAIAACALLRVKAAVVETVRQLESAQNAIGDTASDLPPERRLAAAINGVSAARDHIEEVASELHHVGLEGVEIATAAR